MKLVLSTVSKLGLPWSATVEARFIDGCFFIKLKKQYDHFKNLELNPETVLVINQEFEAIGRARCVSKKDIGDDTAEVRLKPYWVRVVQDGKIEDYSESEAPQELTKLLI